VYTYKDRFITSDVLQGTERRRIYVFHYNLGLCTVKFFPLPLIVFHVLSAFMIFAPFVLSTMDRLVDFAGMSLILF
jgi:hypothetical protein